MNKINLLPLKAQKSKDVRLTTIIIAAVLAVIFLAAFLLFLFFSLWEARLNREIQGLTYLLGERVPYVAGNETSRHFLYEEFLTKDAFKNAQTAPSGISLEEIWFNFGEIGITARTADIYNIQVHMEVLGEYFYDIRLASLAVSYDGYYIYELNFPANNYSR